MYRPLGDIDTTSDRYTPCEIIREPRGTHESQVNGHRADQA